MRNLIITICIGFVVMAVAFLLLPTNRKNEKGLVVTAARSSQGSQSQGRKKQNKTEVPVSTNAKDAQLKLGDQRVFYASGTLSASWDFNKLIDGGILKVYYENGRIWMEAKFVDGYMTGKVKTYYPDGTVWSVVEFDGGQENGTMKMFYPSRFAWLEYNCTRGTINALPSYYNEGDVQKKTAVPPPGEAEKSAYFKAYDASGKLLRQWDSGNANVNTNKVFYKAGTVSLELATTEGSPENSIRMFYPTGEIWFDGKYDQAKWKDSQKTFYKDGKTWCKTSFDKEGLRDVTRIFYPSGTLWITIHHQGPQVNMMPVLVSETVVEATVERIP